MLRRFPLIIAVVLLFSPPAGAQSRDDVRARLSSFSGWATPTRPLSIAIEVTNSGATPLQDVSAVLTIRDRVRSRSALRASLDGNASGDTLATTTEQLDQTIAPGSKTTLTVQRDLGSLASSFRSGRAVSGVYPLGIEVQAGGRKVADLSGAFVFLASTPDAPLNLVWVMPIHRPLAADANGVYTKSSIESELAAGGTARAITDLLANHPTAALTVAPTGLFADQILDLSNGFPTRDDRGLHAVPATDPLAQAAGDLAARMKAALSSPAFEVATATYARAALPSLLSGGLAKDAERQITVAQQRVQAAFGRAPNPALLVDGAYRADERTARMFGALGARTLILDPAVLRNKVEGRFGADRVEDVRAASLSFDGLIVDAPIRDRLELANTDPVLDAMGVVAETAAAYFELPTLAAGRMLVVATSSAPDPAVASPLLDVIAQAPWLKLRTASNAAADPALRPTGDTQRLNDIPAEPAARFAQARAARGSLDTLSRVLVAPSGAEEIDRIDRTILSSESADYDAGHDIASGLARAVRDTTLQRLGQITVPPRRVTLTSRGGQVPVTVVNATGYTIHIKVRLDSQKVAFPTGSTRTIEVPGREGGTTFGTLAFELEARAAGSFPIAVLLETREGDLVGNGQILVRSSAVSAVTFMATAGGALFLAGAWARRAWTRRPKRSASA